MNFDERKARKELQEYLNEHPELHSFQNELEQQFDIYGNDPYVNIQIIKHHLADRLYRLNNIKEELKRK